MTVEIDADELTELREDRAAVVVIYAESVLAGRVSADNLPWIRRRIFAAAREYGELGEALRGCAR